MSIIISVILLLVAVVGANIVSLIWPKIPLALFQITAGLLLSFDPQFHFSLNPEIFMLAIIAPLMFNDGQNQSMTTLTRNVRPMLSMAVGLVIATVLVTGLLAHSTWPALTLPLAFMLGAIITPTDAVAVGSITQNVVVPEKVGTALEHESLFNDASGIVLFDLALATFVSGNFSITTGILSFLKTFFGGLILGWLIGILIVSLRIYLTRTHTDISAIIIPVNVMTPLLTYWLAEELGVSGILAVVAVGLVHGLLHNRLRLTSTKLQIVSKTTWTILSDILNGFVFVLLGVSMPSVIASISIGEITHLLGVAVLLYCVMFVIRFGWIRLRLARIEEPSQTVTQSALQVAVGGIHGTITLAMAFSIPTMIHGHAFNLRTEIIFVAAAVILISLAVATIVYPLILKAKEASFTPSEFKQSLTAMVYHAANQLRDNNPASHEVEYVNQVINSQIGFGQRIDRNEYMQLLKKTRDLELVTIDQLTDDGEIDESTRALYQKFLGHTSVNTGPRGVRDFLHLWTRQLRRTSHRKKMIRQKKRQYQRWSNQHPDQVEQNRQQARDHHNPVSGPNNNFHDRFQQQRQELGKVMSLTGQAVIDYLNSIQTSDNMNLVSMVKASYTQRTQQFQSSESFDSDQLAGLFVQAFQYEHSFVQEQLANKKINIELANELNEQISTDELVYMQNQV